MSISLFTAPTNFGDLLGGFRHGTKAYNVLVKRHVRSTRPVEAAGRNALKRFVIRFVGK